MKKAVSLILAVLFLTGCSFEVNDAAPEKDKFNIDFKKNDEQNDDE
ncbi:membrane lipoprotein lipid attachment site-containing protein [Planococcus sp. N028]|uniref:Membrane lipoprotein lipid attachment site-containing protein n=1 Tax=Planococcus shixiaomingii TaxID=3058393 RepID=A0ABT8MYZ5_9BACL|nr:membrane lipoprotein lipid attachment site-containing protein [Planococcus sp. N028]MDN7240683.1 membrane lipoprotein lipid attachment site-containing protein [Planococcus sp. N028]